MENKERALTSRGRPFSPTREAVLTVIEKSGSARTAQGLSAELGLHDNTVRMHLTALHRDGFIRQTANTESTGRGRPATQWEALTRTSSPYVELVKVLARQLRKESDQPQAAAREAGVSWGRALAEQHSARTAVDPRTPKETLIEILRAEGFAPEQGDDTIEFRQCPLIEAASADPDIVCAAHLGMVTGALERLGARSDGSTLAPFAAPGVCTLQLRLTS